jgi:NADH-quinone oxidoreductase subunit N
VAAYFYVRVIVLMFFTEPTDDTPQVVAPGILSKIAIAVCAAITVILGIFPQPLLELADHAAQLLQ